MENKSIIFLAIDSHEGNLITLNKQIKESFPYADFVSASTGEEGFKLAKINDPDVILIDIVMQGVDAIEICASIKKDEILKDTPIIFITEPKVDRVTRIKAIDCGGEAFLMKPVDKIELYVQLRSMLKIRENNLLKKAETIKYKKIIDEKSKMLTQVTEKYKTILNNLPAMVCEYLPDSTLTYTNNAYAKNHNMTSKQITGKKFLELLPETERERTKNEYMSINKLMPEKTSTLKTVKNNIIKWEEWRDIGVFDSKGEISHYYAIGIDITERKFSEEKLIFLSYRDYLTKLYNRRFFEEEVKRLNKRRNLPITIIMADVNGLKLVNDSFGHKAGDELLIKAAKAITEGCREDDIIARIGGDEFAILLPNTSRLEAEMVMNRIKTITELATDEKSVLSISFGCETKAFEEQDIIETLSEAENQMYKRKMYESSSMRSKTVDVVMNSLYEKSQREMAHSKRVSELCYLIAQNMNFDSKDAVALKIAGLVHDIGKIGVAESILNKQERLNEPEWLEIKKHPEAGWRILSSVKEFAEIAEFVLAHHEFWNGEGYPNSLKGEEIPLESRIIKVADAFDAMVSDRPYRKAMGTLEAIEELKLNSGIQFDPQIVNVLINHLESNT